MAELLDLEKQKQLASQRLLIPNLFTVEWLNKLQSTPESHTLDYSLLQKTNTIDSNIYSATFERDGPLAQVTGLRLSLPDVIQLKSNYKIDFRELETIPPGFTRGLKSKGEELPASDCSDIDEDSSSDEELSVEESPEFLEKLQIEQSRNQYLNSDEKLEDLQDVLPMSASIYIPSNFGDHVVEAKKRHKVWAHVVTRKQFTNFHELVPDMAIQFTFELDVFQKEAIYQIECRNSVFVAAHTSAGKTVIAEYAIALSQRHMTRTIYTSPIKALSNQKYRDFRSKFNDVGLITGDMQINPEASCLIMTTEILRFMLYTNSDIIRDVEFVIFDEVHYVNDLERGVVWEETMIILPSYVSLIMLSATVPNTYEFASWIGRTRQNDVYVVSTTKRPVPLEHYLWAGKSLVKLMDSDGKMLPEGYKEAQKLLNPVSERKEVTKEPPSSKSSSIRHQQYLSREKEQLKRKIKSALGNNQIKERRDINIWSHLCKFLLSENLLPAVAFIFSKRRCDDNANSLMSRDFASRTEKNETHLIFEKAISRLSEDDQKLPQLARMRQMLMKGIAVHHGGLLPIVKEIVEILFSKGLIKILFATETFAMGVNMPAKAVLFGGVKKNDGQTYRTLYPGEYIQMAGRAGRRGLDAIGTVILVPDPDFPDYHVLYSILQGTPMKLRSQFRLTYNMILSLLLVENIKIEEMMKRSFSENVTQIAAPDIQEKIKNVEESLSNLESLHLSNDVDSQKERILISIVRWSELTKLIYDKISELPSKIARKVFCYGRVVVLSSADYQFKLAVLLQSFKSQEQKSLPTVLILGSSADELDLELESLKIKKTNFISKSIPWLPPFRAKSQKYGRDQINFGLDSIEVADIRAITTRIVNLDYNGIIARKKKAFDDLFQNIAANNVLDFSIDCWNEVDLRSLSSSFEVQELLEERFSIENTLQHSDNPLLDHNIDIKELSIEFRRQELNQELVQLRLEISEENLLLFPEYHQRLKVLQELNYIDKNYSVRLKGRVAAEIHTADPIILTEILFENILQSYENEEIVSLLSILVFEEKGFEKKPALSFSLEKGKEHILEIARKVEKIQDLYQISGFQDSTSLDSPNRFEMMQVTYEWARGLSFAKIMELTDLPEGSIVRAMIRLDEVLRECLSCARIIGDATLHKRITQCQGLIKRDVIWAPSLYV